MKRTARAYPDRYRCATVRASEGNLLNQQTIMTAITALMNNGQDTWIFTIDGDAAEVRRFNHAGVEATSDSELAITTRQQARTFWSLAFQVAASCMSKGSAMPKTCTIWPEYALIQDEADIPLPFGIY